MTNFTPDADVTEEMCGGHEFAFVFDDMVRKISTSLELECKTP